MLGISFKCRVLVILVSYVTFKGASSFSVFSGIVRGVELRGFIRRDGGRRDFVGFVVSGCIAFYGFSRLVLF